MENRIIKFNFHYKTLFFMQGLSSQFKQFKFVIRKPVLKKIKNIELGSYFHYCLF